MHTGVLWEIFYWLSTPTMAVVAGILLWRKLTRAFPFFFSYIAASFLGDMARLFAYQGSPSNYAYTYWITQLVNTVFMLLATYELSLIHLFPGFYKVSFYRYLFSIVAVIAVGLGVFTALGSITLAVLGNAINILNVLQVLALLFFVGLMVFMGRRWGHYEFGIGLGLGLNTTAFVIMFAVFLKNGPIHGILRELPVFALDASCIIWLITFLTPEKTTPAPTQPVSPEVLEEAKKWQETLKESLGGKKIPD